MVYHLVVSLVFLAYALLKSICFEYDYHVLIIDFCKSEISFKNGDVVDRRRFLVILSSLLGGIGAIFASLPFFSALRPSLRALKKAGPVDVDLSNLLPGKMLTVEWQGKPVWVLRRTPEMIAALEKPNFKLRDPNSVVDQQPSYAKNLWRSRRPDIAVLVGICTHLGCVPQYQAGKDFLCPCHGSVFDLAGRVFKNVPAPVNLAVPPYYYIDDNHLRIGVDK